MLTQRGGLGFLNPQSIPNGKHGDQIARSGDFIATLLGKHLKLEPTDALAPQKSDTLSILGNTDGDHSCGRCDCQLVCTATS